MTWRARLALALSCCACEEPALESQPSLIDRVQVLAVQAEPPEAAPGASVSLRALAVSPAGTLDADLQWAFCSHARGVAENNSVPPECLALEAEWLTPVAAAPAGEPVQAMLPVDGCSLFGSQPLPPDPGQPPRRPADPDATGGYYQPVRTLAEGAEAAAFGHVRLHCALPSAPVDVAREYGERYSDNRNPELLAFTSQAATLRASAPLELSASWTAESREAYVVYDSADARLVERTEQLRVSWFATAGSFSSERSEAAAGETSVSVVYRAPSSSGQVALWAVLRDDRGGVSFGELSLEVE